MRHVVWGIASALWLTGMAHGATVQDFDAPGAAFAVLQLDQPPPPTLAAGPTGNQLRLAFGAGTPPNHNTLTFERTDPGPFCGMTASFDFTVTPGTGRADGLGFALLDTAAFGPEGGVSVEGPLFAAEEPNFQRSLGIGFDVFQNVAEGDPNNNHLSVHWNGTRIAQVDAGAVDLAAGTRIHATVTLATTPGPAVTVVLTPTAGSPVTLINALAVPGLMPYEGRVWFGARSGGLAAHHDLDNVNVTTAACPASQVGEWSSSLAWPVVAIHSHLLPDGRVLFWDRFDAAGDGDPRFFDPATGLVTAAPPAVGHDLFCSGHVLLPDGRLFVTGGHIIDGVGLPNTSIYDPQTGTWTPQPMMNAGRWYPTAVLLANGDVFVASGNIDNSIGVNLVPQVWQAASGTWRTLGGASGFLPLYPYLFLAPDGRVFTAGPQETTGFFDTTGSGTFAFLASSAHGFREYGSAVLYDVGKVMIAGGADPPTDAVEVIDLTTPTPNWETVAPMAYRRRQHNLTLLPDETVLATGGSSAPGFNNAEGSVFPAELWDPVAETWRTLQAANEARLYHSEAVLLPDARVLVSGGGHPSGGGDDPNHFSAELYSPPYLFNGPRPTITAAPATVRYNESFSVVTPDGASITKVTWLRLSSVTHAFNMNQRLNRLAFSTSVGGLNVTAPPNPRFCPPGHYMMFLVNAAGVPSEARIVRIILDLFADGFETGDTSAWSLVVAGS